MAGERKEANLFKKKGSKQDNGLNTTNLSANSAKHDDVSEDTNRLKKKLKGKNVQNTNSVKRLEPFKNIEKINQLANNINYGLSNDNRLVRGTTPRRKDSDDNSVMSAKHSNHNNDGYSAGNGNGHINYQKDNYLGNNENSYPHKFINNSNQLHAGQNSTGHNNKKQMLAKNSKDGAQGQPPKPPIYKREPVKAADQHGGYINSKDHKNHYGMNVHSETKEQHSTNKNSNNNSNNKNNQNNSNNSNSKNQNNHKNEQEGNSMDLYKNESNIFLLTIY